MKLFFAELKKLIKNSVVLITAATLFSVCAAAALYGTTLRTHTPKTANQLQQSYKTQTASFVKTAEHNRREAKRLGAGENSYTYQYYTKIIDIYTEANKTVTIENGSAEGWDEVLDSGAPLLLSLLGSAVIGALAVYEEKRTGMLLLIRSAKNGRGKTNVCKIITAMLFSAVFCLIISAVYISVFYLTGNLSSGAAELQTANGFAYSPYKITLFEAFAALTMQRTAVCAVTGGVFAIISYFLNSYVSIFAAGTVLYGMEFAFFKMNFKAVDVFIKNVNVFSLGTPYFLKRYYSVRLFGESGAFEVSAALTVLIAVGLIVFAAVSNIRVLPARRKNAASKKSKPARKEKSASARGVVYWEIKKRILTPVMVAVLLAGGCARVLLSFYTLKTNGNAAARIYRDYCAVFSQKELKDAKDDIYEEYSRVQQGLEMKNEAERLKANGSITEEKYDEMIFEYEYSSARARIIEYCTERLDYLFSVSSEDNNVRFVYDTGLEKLLGADFDIVLVLLLLICLSPSFSSEHETGFYPIMNTAKNGRGVTFLAKIVSALIITTALFAVFSVCDICVSYSYGAFDDLSASAVSVEYAANVSPYWSIGGLVARIFAVRYVSYIAFSLLILSLSGIMRKTLAATSISAAAVTVPYGVRALSGSVLPADLSALMAGGLTLCKGTYGTFDFLPFAAASVLTAALTFSYADTGRIRFLRDILRFRKRQG